MIEPVSVPILLDVELSVEDYDLEIATDDYDLDFDSAIVVRQFTEDDYEGPYVVVPSEQEQTLYTENKVLRKNVTVKEVPFSLATISQINRLF